MQSIDTDQFRVALERGISTARSAGADVTLINAQHSPRTESIIALGTYASVSYTHLDVYKRQVLIPRSSATLN